MDLAELLRTHRLVAIVRGRDPDASLRCVLTLHEEGVVLVEESRRRARVFLGAADRDRAR